MAKRKKYHHKKMGMPRKVMKTIGTVAADGAIILPAAIPLAMVASTYMNGKGTITLHDSVNATTSKLWGMSVKDGTYDLAKITTYGIFSAVLVTMGVLAKKYVVKRV